MITTQCPHCGATYEVQNDLFGKFVQCRACDKGFIVGQSSLATTNQEPKNTSTGNISLQEHMPSLKTSLKICASITLFVAKIGIMVFIPLITLGNLSNSCRGTYSYRFESRRSIEESFAVKQAKVLGDISDNVDAVATKCDAIALLLLFPCMAFTYRILFPTKKDKKDKRD